SPVLRVDLAPRGLSPNSDEIVAIFILLDAIAPKLYPRTSFGKGVHGAPVLGRRANKHIHDRAPRFWRSAFGRLAVYVFLQQSALPSANCTVQRVEECGLAGVVRPNEHCLLTQVQVHLSQASEVQNPNFDNLDAASVRAWFASVLHSDRCTMDW